MSEQHPEDQIGWQFKKRMDFTIGDRRAVCADVSFTLRRNTGYEESLTLYIGEVPTLAGKVSRPNGGPFVFTERADAAGRALMLCRLSSSSLRPADVVALMNAAGPHCAPATVRGAVKVMVELKDAGKYRQFTNPVLALSAADIELARIGVAPSNISELDRCLSKLSIPDEAVTRLKRGAYFLAGWLTPLNDPDRR